MKKPRYYRKFDYDRQRLPNAHLAHLEQGVTTIDEAVARTGYTIGQPGWGLLYYALVCHLDPAGYNALIETGTNQGCSTIIMAQALKDAGGKGRVYTVESEADHFAKARNNFEAAGLTDWIEPHLGRSHDVLRQVLPTLTVPVRAAFLDASHLFADVMGEFELLLPYLAPGAIVIFDNTANMADPGEDPRVHGALKEIQRRHGGQLVNWDFVSWYTPGMAIWQAGARPAAAQPPPP